MTRRRQARSTSAARLLGVVAVLLGLLAMHGLVSGHHTPTAPVLTQPASAVTALGADHQQAAHGLHAAPAPSLVGALLAASRDVLRAAGCTDCPQHAMAMLCLAVLSAGLALLTLLLAQRGRAAGLPAPQLRLPLLRAGPPLRLRPPDLVSQLCVSRT